MRKRPVHIKVDEKTMARLDEWCKHSGLKRSEVIRAALARYLPSTAVCPVCKENPAGACDACRAKKER